MQIGVLGLDSVGSRIVRSLLAAEHQCVVFDGSRLRVAELAAEKAYGAASIVDLALELDPPRIIFLAGRPDEAKDAFEILRPALTPGDLVVDVSIGDYGDHLERARALALAGVDYVQVWMTDVSDNRPLLTVAISGDEDVLRRIEPLLRQVRSVRETAGVATSSDICR